MTATTLPQSRLAPVAAVALEPENRTPCRSPELDHRIEESRPAMTRTQYLAALADRTGPLVETLRAAAALLRGLHGPVCDPVLRDDVADALEAASQRLCEHVRRNADGTCRYCNLPSGDSQ